MEDGAGQALVGRDHASQTQIAYHELERRIITMDLRPGEVVSEKMLASSLEIGRTPVREALRDLAREGLVTILPQRGIIISEIEVSKQLRLIETHRALLKLVAGASARRMNAARREEFIALAAQIERALEESDESMLFEQDAALVELLLRSSRNEFAGAALRLHDGLSRRFARAHFSGHDLTTLLGVAMQLSQAVADGDEASAVAQVDTLLDLKVKFARQVLEMA